MKTVSILIPSWCPHEALYLCIESIKKRTAYKPYKIVVCDSSPADSAERSYLRACRDGGILELIEVPKRQAHVISLNALLTHCDTDYACVLDSDVEIMRSDWLDFFMNKLPNYEQDLGVGGFVKGMNRPGFDFFQLPWFHPAVLVLNMHLYRQFRQADDWGLFKEPMNEFKCKYKDKIIGHEKELLEWFEDIELNRVRVEYDTGMKFATRLVFENPRGFKMHKISIPELDKYVHHYGSMSLWKDRLGEGHMVPKMVLLREHLRKLRGGI